MHLNSSSITPSAEQIQPPESDIATPWEYSNIHTHKHTALAPELRTRRRLFLPSHSMYSRTCRSTTWVQEDEKRGARNRAMLEPRPDCRKGPSRRWQAGKDTSSLVPTERTTAHLPGFLKFTASITKSLNPLCFTFLLLLVISTKRLVKFFHSSGGYQLYHTPESCQWPRHQAVQLCVRYFIVCLRILQNRQVLHISVFKRIE